jgi:hypothetical protein
MFFSGAGWTKVQDDIYFELFNVRISSAKDRSETPLVQREAAQGRRRTQEETRDASLTLHSSLLEARDLALDRGSPPVYTEAHTVCMFFPTAMHVLSMILCSRAVYNLIKATTLIGPLLRTFQRPDRLCQGQV